MKTEHALKRDVDRYLKQCNLWYLKVHGSRFQRAGVPDFVGCARGRFFSIELKRDPSMEPRPRQQVEIRRIQLAGGRAFVCSSVDEVRNHVERLLAEI